MLEALKQTGQRIKIARLLTNLTRKEFCKKHTINPHTLLSLETGRLPLSEKKTRELIRAFSNESIICTASWLLEGRGEIPRKLEDIHNIKKEDSFPETEEEEDEGLAIFKEIETFTRGSKDAFVTIVGDDAMVPLYNVGDYVGGKFVPQEEIDQLLGEICIIEIKKDNFVVRHFFKNDTSLVLSGTNPRCKLVPPLSVTPKIIRAAKVIWHRCQS